MVLMGQFAVGGMDLFTGCAGAKSQDFMGVPGAGLPPAGIL